MTCLPGSPANQADVQDDRLERGLRVGSNFLGCSAPGKQLGFTGECRGWVGSLEAGGDWWLVSFL